MNTIDRSAFIRELRTIIDRYVNDYRLFCGGCCYSAYLLAAALKKAGIKYKTVIWQYQDILDVTDFNQAINGKGVSHVAIEVGMGRKRIVIGDDSGIREFFMNHEYLYNVRKYDGIEPDEILAGYRNNNWNVMYDTRYNTPLRRDIQKVTSKYVGKLDVKISYKRSALADFFRFFFI